METSKLRQEIFHYLRQGGVLLADCDTVPGLFCSARHPAAVARIRDLKKRDPHKGFIVMTAQAQALAHTGEAEKRLIDCFWPGPLTIVMPLRDRGLAPLSPDGRTIALRWPDHPFWSVFLRSYGLAVLTTSANPFDRVFADRRKTVRNRSAAGAGLYDGSAEHCLLRASEPVGWMLFDRHPRPGLSSTIVQMQAGRPVLLRAGDVRAEDIQQCLR